jgi:isoquinoline 1-oxidoreductase beta subunit
VKKIINGKATKLSRRNFIVGSTVAAGGGLALGFHLPLGIGPAAAQSAADAGAEINAWVVVKPDDTCVIRIARSEMGQGTRTGLAQLVAEELECDWKKVATESITPGQNLGRKRVWGEMGTGGSRGIRTSQDYVRRGGAAARMMLLQAAADQWQVPVNELSVADGIITHAASKRSTGYGKVAAAAALLTAPDPKTIKLKDPKAWKIAGKPMKRLDTADKLNGSKVYAIDVSLPGMLCAAIKDCPVFGGKLESYDESKIAGRPGVRRVVKVKDTAVAVVADTWWRAKAALDALPIVWDEGPGASQSSALIAEHLKEGLNASATNGDWHKGDAIKAIAGAAKKVEAVYSTPFLAHATMEPMNCTAKISADKAEIWVATQNSEASLAALSESSGVPLAKCEVYRHDLGGGFGRRGGPQDYVRQAVAIAQQFPGVPVKMIWSREEDMAHDFYRPISQCRGVAGLDADGNLVGLHVRVSGQSINAFSNPAGISGGKDVRQLQGLYEEPGDAQLGYTVPNLLIDYAMRNTHVPVGAWRGVNTNQNAVYMECFIDEVARAAGKDPLAFRRALMQDHPRHLAVLNAAAEKGDWGKPLPPGVHRGIAQFMGYGSYSASVAEVSVSPQGKLKVHRLVLALNCGHAVNPDQIAAQVEGSVVYGLSAALYGECTVANGRMEKLNFDSYEVLRLAEMPKVETVIVPTYDFWGGVGEPTISVVTPAVLNAIHAATGKPVRSLPLKNVKLV